MYFFLTNLQLMHNTFFFPSFALTSNLKYNNYSIFTEDLTLPHPVTDFCGHALSLVITNDN